ncbi:MAG: hypothetical protein AAGH15_00065 [Myxococcota bacterium]
MANRQLSLDFDGSAPEEAPEPLDAPRGPAALDADEATPEVLRRAALRLTERLADALARPVRLVVTDNRRTMVSARASGPRIEVRLHHMFLSADEAVVNALGRYLARRDREAGARVDAFIDAHRDRIDRRRRRHALLRTRGVVHDLRELFEELEGDFAPGAMEGVRVTWGRRVRRRPRQRSIQLGTYVPQERLIRIHPVLDQAWVPRFYVASVLHHEMLHHAIPPEREGKRLRYHSETFRAHERAFRHHAQATRWEKSNLARLLRGVPTES